MTREPYEIEDWIAAEVERVQRIRRREERAAMVWIAISGSWLLLCLASALLVAWWMS